MQRGGVWRESKYRITGQAISGSRNPRELARSSRIPADLVAEFYSVVIPRWARGELGDFGCGKAPLYAFYRNYCSSVTLADWPNSLHENPLLDVVVDLNRPLIQFESSSFDTVILSDVLEHIFEPRQLLTEISRILRPGGHVILNVPFIYPLHETPHDYYRFTNYTLEKFAAEAGLVVVSIDGLGGWIEVLGDLLSKFLAQANLWLLVSAIHRVVMALHRGPWKRKLANRGRHVVPLGYGMVLEKPVRSPEETGRSGP